MVTQLLDEIKELKMEEHDTYASAGSTTTQTSLPHREPTSKQKSPRQRKHSEKLRQLPDQPPADLKDAKQNLAIHEYGEWNQICSRKVFCRKWVKTADALEIVAFPQRSPLSCYLNKSGHYWLKTGEIRKTPMPAGGKQSDPRDPTFKVLC